MEKVAIIVGHSSTDKGAANRNSKISEFDYNKMVAEFIKDLAVDFKPVIVFRKHGYNSLPGEVNALGPYLNISLHCNAFNKIASGTETLSSGSKNSMLFAQILHQKLIDLFELPNRGIKVKSREDRGGLILHATKAPTVLLEPFFIDNDSDLLQGQNKAREYAVVICEAVCEYFEL